MPNGQGTDGKKPILDYTESDFSVPGCSTATLMARSTHHLDYQTFLGLLRDLRVGAGLTQVMLAKKLGNTQTFISKVERGERRLDLVEFVEVCEALSIDPRAAFDEYMTRRESRRPVSRKLTARQRKR